MTSFDKLKSLTADPAQTKVNLDVDTITEAMMDTMREELIKQAGGDPSLAHTSAEELRTMIGLVVAKMTAGILESAYEANSAGNPYRAMGTEAAEIVLRINSAVQFALYMTVKAKGGK